MTRTSPIILSAAAILHVSLCALAGCDKSEPPAAAAPAEAPAADHAEHAEHAAHAAHTDKAAAPPTVQMPSVPAGAKVAFGALTAGQVVKGALVDGKVQIPVKMVAEGIAVKPAGMPEQGSGHHHIIIDGAAPAKGAVVPKDETHIHFGKGQTETVLAVAPGEHSLTLQFADGLHRSYGPELSATIKIKVEAQ